MFILPSWLRDLVVAVAGACIMLVLTLGYWKGLPLLNDRTEFSLPLIGTVTISEIPLIGSFAVGHLQLEKDKAAKAARKDLVAAAELSTEKAKVAKLLGDLSRVQQLKEAAEAETEQLARQEKEDRDATDAATSADDGGDAARYTAGDRKWLCQHRRRYC